MNPALLDWLRVAALAYDDFFRAEIDDTGIPDCQDISMTLCAAAGIHQPITVQIGEARGSDVTYSDIHYWLDVDGQRFDPKAYVLTQRYDVRRKPSRVYLSYRPDAEPAFSADHKTEKAMLKEAQEYSPNDLAAAVAYVIQKAGIPPAPTRSRHRK